MPEVLSSPFAIRQDPPISNRGGAKNGSVQTFVDVCRSDPGQWYMYSVSYKTGSATGAFRTRFPDTEWRSSTNGQGRVDLFCRYVGEGYVAPQREATALSVAPPRPAAPPSAELIAWNGAARWDDKLAMYIHPDGLPEPAQ